ncbi:hypothetical protein LX95_01861 [Mesonia algae]|uniref:Uncharacterized protein n=1 Tax=Mesonia algae TaxID=213248 RepID=A0A2W7IQ52_9FLAO|nr:PA2169 family four-helix-bundle protein [Mesonia algae]PZW40793.1 hypothetical protein LX95_01861 [Mesonia algae]
MDLKSTLYIDNDEAILEECIGGDKAAKEEYETVLSDFSGVGNEIEELIVLQKEKLEDTLSKVKSLEDIE